MLPPDKQSLPKFQRYLTEAGVPISLGTLKGHSRRFDWQRRLAEANERSERRDQEERLTAAARANESYARLGRAMSGVGGRALQSLLANPDRLERMSPGEIARVIESGIRTESRALGVDQDRNSLAVALLNGVVQRVVPAFLDGNDDPDPARRAERFAVAVDRIGDEWLQTITEGGSSDVG